MLNDISFHALTLVVSTIETDRRTDYAISSAVIANIGDVFRDVIYI